MLITTQDLRHIGDILSVIEDKVEYLNLDILEVRSVFVTRRSLADQMQITGLKDNIERLSNLPDIPFDDEYALSCRAGRLATIWTSAL